jgi:hypothetical protein
VDSFNRRKNASKDTGKTADIELMINKTKLELKNIKLLTDLYH